MDVDQSVTGTNVPNCNVIGYEDVKRYVETKFKIVNTPSKLACFIKTQIQPKKGNIPS